MRFSLSGLVLASVAAANVTVVPSLVDGNVTISYKEAHVCETIARVYSGFVQVPGDKAAAVGGFDLNTYFLYFEARESPETAPLAIYLAGGPGEASSYAAFAGESGPCIANVFGNDTTANPWSFNKHANVLYIDQPVQAGYSYSTLINGTLDVAAQEVTETDFGGEAAPASNGTRVYGLFAAQAPLQTTNTTVGSGKALVLFAKHWLASFPGYQTASPRISIWGNSYGGFWVPEFAAQLDRYLIGRPSPAQSARPLVVDAIGITNGCIDLPAFMPGWPTYAYNNTYDVSFITEDQYRESIDNITKPGGCLDQAAQCRALGRAGDPDFLGANATVNDYCEAAFIYCETIVGVLNSVNNVSAFDVAVAAPDTCSFYPAVSTYLNTPAVQDDLGVPLHWLWDSPVVTTVFGLAAVAGLSSDVSGTGDSLRQDGLANLEYLLDRGARVALIYGDRDYRCPWTGAEATARQAVWSGHDRFADAGYTAVQGLSATARGAVVKQAGRLSFTRVFDAGHQVSAYAPEAVFAVFNRTLAGRDVATGALPAHDDLRTDGPADSYGWRNTMPTGAPFQNTCVINGTFLPENPWLLA